MYREEIAKLNQWIALGLMGAAIVLYYAVGENVMMCLLVSGSLLIYAIIKRGGALENRVTKFFSGISMEIYLSHMVIFRVVEKLGLHRVIANGWLQYILTVVIVISGTTFFAVAMQRIICLAEKKLLVRKRRV